MPFWGTHTLTYQNVPCYHSLFLVGWKSFIAYAYRWRVNFVALSTISLANRNTAGFVYLRFENTQSAIGAQRSLHGRWFAGKMITATFMVLLYVVYSISYASSQVWFSLLYSSNILVKTNCINVYAAAPELWGQISWQQIAWWFANHVFFCWAQGDGGKVVQHLRCVPVFLPHAKVWLSLAAKNMAA